MSQQSTHDTLEAGSPGIAVDFAFERPTIAQLQDAGVTIVIRYVLGAGKAITKAELASYLAAGISVAFVHEYGANDIAGGFAGGVTSANAVIGAMTVLGVWPCPVYFAADEDVPVSASAEPYYQGAASVIGSALLGDYAEGAVMLDLHAKGITTFHWLSESTGFPGYQEALDSGIVALEQKVNASPVSGTDVDEILLADVGQYPRLAPTPPPLPEGVTPDMITMVQHDDGTVDIYYLSCDGKVHQLSRNTAKEWTHYAPSDLAAWMPPGPIVP